MSEYLYNLTMTGLTLIALASFGAIVPTLLERRLWWTAGCVLTLLVTFPALVTFA